jgi:hypothetical protein
MSDRREMRTGLPAGVMGQLLFYRCRAGTSKILSKFAKL